MDLAVVSPDVFRVAAARAGTIGEFGDAFAFAALGAFAFGATAFMWENAWKRRVFGAQVDEGGGVGDGETTVLHGVDVSRYPIFNEPEVRRALGFAASWHRGRRRKNGDTYARHCVESAKILAANLPGSGAKSRDALVACLLHDVLDDTGCSEEALRDAFGTRVYNLVVQVSRVGSMNQVLRRRRRGLVDGEVKSRLSEEDLSQLKTILLLIVRDPRVFLIKIADRLHNMRTIYAISSKEKAMDIANETLQVWCSLAEKLGMWAIKSELEDLCFAVLEPENFDAVQAARNEAWTPMDADDDDGKDSASRWLMPFFGLDSLPFFNASEKSGSGSFDADEGVENVQYSEYQLEVKRRIDSIPSFDWISTREGDPLQYDRMTELPESIAASLNTLDGVRGRLWSELLMDGYDSDLKISISSRLKSAYSTHQKMKRKGIAFRRVCDARAMRIVVGEASTSERGTEGEIDACYALLDLIHKMYRPIEGEYDDYIINPKQTGYRSLHTAVHGPDGAPFEVQVRTRSMHDAAEFGIAAQWMYKGKAMFASKSYQDAAQTDDVPKVGSGVQLVSSGRRSCGVVIESGGSRMLVAEPKKSQWSDVIAWMAEGHDEALLKMVEDSGLRLARQGTSEFFISEFCYCVDKRWHRVDNLGHKTRVTAEIVDERVEMSGEEISEMHMDDIDVRIRQLQTIAGQFLNDSSSSSEAGETELANWSATAAAIQKRKRLVEARRKQKEREENWRSGDIESPALSILMARSGRTAKPKSGIFQTEEAAKFEAEVALSNPSANQPNVDVEDGVMIITWNDQYPELHSVKRGSTVAEIRGILASSDSSVESSGRVNVNMVMVPPTTTLKDGDMIFLDKSTVAGR